MSEKWTEKQGQYLAFIHNYSKIHGRSPAESDPEKYFRVTPPTIHQMVLKLEEKGLISRIRANNKEPYFPMADNNDIPQEYYGSASLIDSDIRFR
ncbi:MAG: MarR family winged helix-turn-helix transcriptional regulator [Desulfuromonadales bacterium]